MPPPRRRRPVQPATRVRLPRSARSHPVTEAGPETAAGETATVTAAGETATETAAGETGTGETVEGRGGELAVAVDTGLDTGLDEDAKRVEDAWVEPDAGAGPAAEPDAGAGPAAEPVAGQERRHPLLLPACLGAVAVILGGLATWFGLAAGNAGSGVNTQNIALIDPAATRQVNQAIDSAVNTIFSYNYADVAKTRQAAQHLLTGQAIGQYNRLFKLVAQDAPQEKLVLTTTVIRSGVELLEGDRARLLIFINQSDTSNAVHRTTTAGAMFSVTAVRQGGQWKISAINTFTRL